jgi:hypothetical protein
VKNGKIFPTHCLICVLHPLPHSPINTGISQSPLHIKSKIACGGLWKLYPLSLSLSLSPSIARGMLFIVGLLVIIVVLVLVHKASSANDSHDHHCPPSSCGNIDNISYPFRLKADPPICSDQRCNVFDSILPKYVYRRLRSSGLWF